MVGEPIYVRVKTGKIHRTAEIVEDLINIDYDADDRVLGIEILDGMIDNLAKFRVKLTEQDKASIERAGKVMQALDKQNGPQTFQISDAWYRRLANSFLEQLCPLYVAQIMEPDGVGQQYFQDDYFSGKLKHSLETFPEWIRKQIAPKE